LLFKFKRVLIWFACSFVSVVLCVFVHVFIYFAIVGLYFFLSVIFIYFFIDLFHIVCTYKRQYYNGMCLIDDVPYINNS